MEGDNYITSIDQLAAMEAAGVEEVTIRTVMTCHAAVSYTHLYPFLNYQMNKKEIGRLVEDVTNRYPLARMSAFVGGTVAS